VQRVVIGVGDLAVSGNPEIVLSTYALGSCVGVVAYDPAAGAGGIIHLMLPDSGIAPERVAKQPALFADTGLALFFESLASLGSRPGNVRLLVAGGASLFGGPDPFRIGGRNTRATLEYMRDNGFAVRHAIVGGGVNRALHLEMATGIVTLKTPTEEAYYPLAPKGLGSGRPAHAGPGATAA
jgi:chemotaxis protein CheD